MSDILLTRQQVAAILQVSVATLRRWDQNGTLRSVHIGNSEDYRGRVVRYRPEDVEALAREGRRAEARTA